MSNRALIVENDPGTIRLLKEHLAEVSGRLEVLRRLRGARESLGYLPVVVLTGDSSKVARNAALILGADDFRTKPLDPQEVVLRVRNLLPTRHLFEEALAAPSPPIPY